MTDSTTPTVYRDSDDHCREMPIAVSPRFITYHGNILDATIPLLFVPVLASAPMWRCTFTALVNPQVASVTFMSGPYAGQCKRVSLSNLYTYAMAPYGQKLV